MARHDPELTKAFEANRAAIAVASIPETDLQNFMAMTPAERRYQASTASFEAVRFDLLADRGRDDADYHRRMADQQRAMLSADMVEDVA